MVGASFPESGGQPPMVMVAVEACCSLEVGGFSVAVRCMEWRGGRERSLWERWGLCSDQLVSYSQQAFGYWMGYRAAGVVRT